MYVWAFCSGENKTVNLILSKIKIRRTVVIHVHENFDKTDLIKT